MRSRAPGRGFTLVEVAVAVAIVAILATMAVPPMINGIVRRQIVEAVPLADVVKNAVAVSWSMLHALPTDNAGAGLPPAAKIVNNYVSSVAIVGGAIDITFGNNVHRSIAGKVLTLRPAVVADTHQELWLLYHRDLRASARVMAMRDFLAEVCRGVLTF